MRVHNRTGRREEAFRAVWMGDYEDRLVELDPSQRGKVDWDTAKHYYFKGLGAKEAAERHISPEAP